MICDLVEDGASNESVVGVEVYVPWTSVKVGMMVAFLVGWFGLAGSL